jgi:succinate dehydrogenase/fumarate reductase flavoprotein subunit
MDAGIVVNGNGVRIGDEAFGHEEYSLIDWPLDNAVAKTDAPGDSWVVVDDAVWQAAVEDDTEIKHLTTAMASPDQLQAEQKRIRRRAAELRNVAQTRDSGSAIASGGYVSAATLDAFTTLMRVPSAALARTLDGFNHFASEGGMIEPPRTGQPEPIRKAPFHAIAIIPGVLFTEGGILINGSGQVLGRQEQPIPGLYAAGNAAGGLQGGPHNGYAGGWSAATTFGLLAAEHALSRRPQAVPA